MEFYPNPSELVHPLKSNVITGKVPDVPSQASNLTLPKIRQRIPRKGLSQSNIRTELKEHIRNNNPFLAQRSGLYTQSRLGDLLPREQFTSIYETSFNQANPKFKKSRPTLQFDNVKDLNDLREIKSPFSYEEVSHRIHGFSRGNFGQPFKP